jgi:GTPase SAR1 family protein
MDKELILLIGPPGVGKTYYCNKFMNHFIRVSQDEQGKVGHFNLFLSCLKDEEDRVLVDRMNFNKKQRSKYITPAIERDYNIHGLVFVDWMEDILVDHIAKRSSHPTLQLDKAKEVIEFYSKNFEFPCFDEGFSSIESISCKKDFWA